MSYQIYKYLILIVFLIMMGCAANQPVTKMEFPEESKPVVKQPSEPETPPVVPMNPRTIELKLRISISNIHVLKGKKLLQHNVSRGVPAAAPPQFHLWCSGIIKHPNQTVMDLKLTGPSPSDIYTDMKNNNKIFYWNLTPLLGKQNKIIIERTIKIQSYELYSLIDTTDCLAYSASGKEYIFYTKSEPFIELTPQIRRTAQTIAGSEPNPFKKAKLLFEWVDQNMTYHFPPKERGANAALKRLTGDSGQYAYLFIALCRAVGVPARFVAGFKAKENNDLNYHAWSEFLLPNHGWIPADPTLGPSQFTKLNNKRMVASVGNNIRLKHAPHWATYGTSEVEESKTGFMQLSTMAYSGLYANINTEIKTIQFQEDSKLISQQSK